MGWIKSCVPIVALIASFIPDLCAQEKPLRIGIAGLTHTHVHWILGRPNDKRIALVGIAEPHRELAARYMQLKKAHKSGRRLN